MMDDYDVFEDGQDYELARKRRVYLLALREMMRHPHGSLVLEELLARGGLGQPIMNDADRVLHNHALALYRDMRDADHGRALAILDQAHFRLDDPAASLEAMGEPE